MHPAASAAPSDKRWPSERFHCIQGCREKAAGHVGETAVRRRRKDASVPSSSATYGPLPRRKQERPELAAQTAVTGHRGSFSCKQVAPRRGAALTLTRLVKNKEKREVMPNNFLIVVYHPPPRYPQTDILAIFVFQITLSLTIFIAGCCYDVQSYPPITDCQCRCHFNTILRCYAGITDVN